MNNKLDHEELERWCEAHDVVMGSLVSGDSYVMLYCGTDEQLTVDSYSFYDPYPIRTLNVRDAIAVNGSPQRLLIDVFIDRVRRWSKTCRGCGVR